MWNVATEPLSSRKEGYATVMAAATVHTMRYPSGHPGCPLADERRPESGSRCTDVDGSCNVPCGVRRPEPGTLSLDIDGSCIVSESRREEHGDTAAASHHAGSTSLGNCPPYGNSGPTARETLKQRLLREFHTRRAKRARTLSDTPRDAADPWGLNGEEGGEPNAGSADYRFGSARPSVAHVSG